MVDFHRFPFLLTGVSGPLASKDWYYGPIKRNECDEMLNHYGADGDFVIRDSETNAGDYSVSLKAPGKGFSLSLSRSRSRSRSTFIRIKRRNILAGKSSFMDVI